MTQRKTSGLLSWLAVAIFTASAGAAFADKPTRGERTDSDDCPYHQRGAYGMMGGDRAGMMGNAGMMGGYDDGMMHGPGMMGGYGIELSAEQRKAVNAIQDQTRKAHLSMMGAMIDEQAKLRDLYETETPDRAAIAASYKRIGEIRQSMYESMVDAQMKMDAVLTEEQRSQRYRRSR